MPEHHLTALSSYKPPNKSPALQAGRGTCRTKTHAGLEADKAQTPDWIDLAKHESINTVDSVRRDRRYSKDNDDFVGTVDTVRCI